MGELQKDQGSHLFASLQSWAYPMSRMEMYAAAQLAKIVNALRGDKEAPFVIDWPWDSDEREPEVTPDEFAELEARLRASSAIPQIRTPEAQPSTTE